MAGVNRIVRTVNQSSVFPDATKEILATSTFNQGDLLVWSPAGPELKVAAAETDGDTFCGIAIQSIVNGKLVSPYTTDVSASQGLSHIAGPVFGVVAKLQLKTGDSLNPGDLVYLDPATSAYAVQAAGTKAIGVYQGAAIAGAAAGTMIEVLLGCRYPQDVLKLA